MKTSGKLSHVKIPLENLDQPRVERRRSNWNATAMKHAKEGRGNWGSHPIEKFLKSSPLERQKLPVFKVGYKVVFLVDLCAEKEKLIP